VTDSVTKIGRSGTYNVAPVGSDFTLFYFIVPILHNSLTNKVEYISVLEVSLENAALGTGHHIHVV
jgi:hypothetical protein